MNIYDYIELKKTWVGLLIESIEASGDIGAWESLEFEACRDMLICEGWDDEDMLIGDCVRIQGCKQIPLKDVEDFMSSNIYDTEKTLEELYECCKTEALEYVKSREDE